MLIATDLSFTSQGWSGRVHAPEAQAVRCPICLQSGNITANASWEVNIEAEHSSPLSKGNRGRRMRQVCVYDGGMCVAEHFGVTCIGKYL